MPLTHAKPVTFINTADRTASDAFYRDVCGCSSSAMMALLRVRSGGAVLRITELQGYAASQHPALGWIGR